MLRIAIVGLGTISKTHVKSINKSEEGNIVAVCDALEKYKADFEGIPFYTDMEEMLKTEKIDCVHLCLPHYLHISAIEACAKYGVNIFTEKPLGMTYDECTRVFDLEEKYGIKIGVCLQNRYNNTSVLLKDLVSSEKYGKLQGVRANVAWKRTMEYYNEKPWRGSMKYAGGGVMINQTIHTLDLMRFIGGEFDTIKAKVANLSLPELDIEDTVSAFVTYQSGITGIFHATIAHCTNAPVSLEFICEDAILKLVDGKCLVQSDSETTMLVEDNKPTGDGKAYYGSSHLTAIEAFYKAIIDDTNEYVPVTEGALAVKIIDTIQKSSKTSQVEKF